MKKVSYREVDLTTSYKNALHEFFVVLKNAEVVILTLAAVTTQTAAVIVESTFLVNKGL